MRMGRVAGLRYSATASFAHPYISFFDQTGARGGFIQLEAENPGHMRIVMERTGGNILFQTLVSGSLLTRLAIAASGNVGIGTTTPAAALDIAGNMRFSGGLYANGVLVADSDGSYYAR